MSCKILLESNRLLQFYGWEAPGIETSLLYVSLSKSNYYNPKHLEFPSVMVWTGHQLPLDPIIYVEVSFYGNRPNKTVLPAHLTPVELLYWFRCWGIQLGIRTAFMEQVLKQKVLPANRNCTAVVHTCKGIPLTLFIYLRFQVLKNPLITSSKKKIQVSK
jgi:hypothetical protein